MVIRDWLETTADQAISGIPRLLPFLAMQPKIVMWQSATSQELPAMKGGYDERHLQMAKKKSAAPIKYVVKYEFDGSPHYGAIHIKDGDRLHLETSHGSRAATLNPKSDVQSLTMILLMELGAKLVSINSHSS